MFKNYAEFLTIPRGLMARILGFHPRGPGSIPGVGGHLFEFMQKLAFSKGNNFGDIIYHWCFFEAKNASES